MKHSERFRERRKAREKKGEKAVSKPRKLGIKTTYIPNAKADMRHRKKVYQHGRERTGLQREQVVVQTERRAEDGQ